MGTYTVTPYAPGYRSAFRYHARLTNEEGDLIATIVTETKWGRGLSVWWHIRNHERNIREAQSFTVTTKR